jgi:hypothetical protein
MRIEKRGNAPENNEARRIKPEIVRDAAGRALFDGLVQRLKSKDIDLRDQSGNPVNLDAGEELGMNIDRSGDIVLSQKLPESEIIHMEKSPAGRQTDLLKKTGWNPEKTLKFTKKMDKDAKEKYLEKLADKQMSYNEKLEEAEKALEEAGTNKEKEQLEKKIADLRDKRDGYGAVITAIEQETADIKRSEFKARKILEQEIVVPSEITKEVFSSLPENLQKQYISDLEDAIDAGEKIIEEYKAALEAGDVTAEEKKEVQARIREEKTEIETKKNLLEKIG